MSLIHRTAWILLSLAELIMKSMGLNLNVRVKFLLFNDDNRILIWELIYFIKYGY